MKERWLFLGLVGLLLLPIWSVEYLPTIDGPSHVYNAWILRQYGNTEEYPLFQQYYEIDWRPIPNWFSHAALALLMFPFGPRAAEKVLLSGLVVLFAFAARFLAGSVDQERGWRGYLALPLLYNQLLLLGFYNFCFSLAFYLLVLGYWWRRRSSPSRGFAVKLNALLLLCWFSHIVSFVLALASLGVLWLVTLPGRPLRRHVVHPLILAPQAILPLWFLRAEGGGIILSDWGLEQLWRYLLRLDVLFLFGKEQSWIGIALAVIFGALLALTLAGKIRGREIGDVDGFLLLSGLAVVVYIMSPEGMSGGTLLKNRLSLYPYLLLIPWIAPRMRRTGKAAILAGLAILTGFQAAMLVHWYRLMQPDIREFLAATGPIAPNTRVLPLLFSRDTSSPRVGVLGHAIDVVAAEKGLVEWDNYEAASGLFPIRYREQAGKIDTYTIEANPGNVNLRAYRGRADYIFTWRLDPGSPIARQLGRQYRLISDTPSGGRVYIRKRTGRGRTPPAAMRE